MYASLILLQIGPGVDLLWLDFLYLLSFVKVLISVTKYIPQGTPLLRATPTLTTVVSELTPLPASYSPASSDFEHTEEINCGMEHMEHYS